MFGDIVRLARSDLSIPKLFSNTGGLRAAGVEIRYAISYADLAACFDYLGLVSRENA